MRVLVVSSYYLPAHAFGGPVVSLSSLCESLVEQGVDVTVLTTNANRPKRLAIQTGVPLDVNGVQVWYYPVLSNRLGNYYSYAQNMAIWRQIESHDIIHANMLWSLADITIMRSGLLKKVPYVVTINGQLYPWALNQKKAKKELFLKVFGNKYLENAAALHCTEVGEAAAVHRIGNGTPAIVLPNGIHPARYNHSPELPIIRKGLGIPESAKVLLFLGRFHQNKRPDIAVDVIAQLADPNIHLVLAGPDEQGMFHKLCHQARAAGCAERVHFAGLLNSRDVIQVLSEVDLLIMPSEVNENFGMAALEALAAGVPVLTSEHVPMGKWAAQAGAGKALPLNPQAFSQAVAELLADPVKLADMGDRGREFVCRRFDSTNIARRMIEHYQSIIETGAPLPDEN